MIYLITVAGGLFISVVARTARASEIIRPSVDMAARTPVRVARRHCGTSEIPRANGVRGSGRHARARSSAAAAAVVLFAAAAVSRVGQRWCPYEFPAAAAVAWYYVKTWKRCFSRDETSAAFSSRWKTNGVTGLIAVTAVGRVSSRRVSAFRGRTRFDAAGRGEGRVFPSPPRPPRNKRRNGFRRTFFGRETIQSPLPRPPPRFYSNAIFRPVPLAAHSPPARRPSARRFNPIFQQFFFFLTNRYWPRKVIRKIRTLIIWRERIAMPAIRINKSRRVTVLFFAILQHSKTRSRRGWQRRNWFYLYLN